MLEIEPDRVAEIILLARREDIGDEEVARAVEDMSLPEQASLVAVFWLGRGSFDIEEFGEALETARYEASVPTADYLLGSPHLADHLQAGLDQLGLPLGELEGALY